MKQTKKSRNEKEVRELCEKIEARKNKRKNEENEATRFTLEKSTMHIYHHEYGKHQVQKYR